MTTKANEASVIEKVFALPGAAVQFATTVLSAAIDQTARGFGDDPTVDSYIQLYRAAQGLYPSHVITVDKMFATMLKRAQPAAQQDQLQASVKEQLARILGESEMNQLELESDALRREELTEIRGDFTERVVNAEPSIVEAWESLPLAAQHSTLCRTEDGLKRAAFRYGSWYARTPSDINQERFINATQACEIVPSLIDDFEDEQAAPLEQLREEGIALQERAAA